MKRQRQNFIIELHLPARLASLLVPARWVHHRRTRWIVDLFVMLFMLTVIIPLVQPHLTAHSYALDSNSASLLPATNAHLAAMVKYTSQDDSYHYNASTAEATTAGNSINDGGSHVSAVFPSSASKGITVTDPVNSIDFETTPQFATNPAEQQKNRIIYPLADGSGWLVYSLAANGVKEDIILRHADASSYSYKLNLGNQLAAHLLNNGDVGIYGNTLFSGTNISTGTSSDAALLQKARKNAAKDTLLFVIPAPTINQVNGKTSGVKAHYELHGSTLTLAVSDLPKGNYPLSLDPSVYVTSAQQFMQGNNESNIDYDTTNDLIQKGKLTGARVASWTTDLALNSARWNAGYATGGGYEYVVGGSSGSTSQTSVYWAQFGSTSNSLATPTNPGTTAGGCNSSQWCTNSAYNLPSPRVGLSSVVYNGYLYAIGGSDSSCTGTNNVCSTVYVSRLGANGEPTAWVSTGALNTGRRFAGITVYNNHIYIAGGQTNTTLNGNNTVEIASVNPDGTINSWTTSSTVIPTAGRWGASVLQYNGYLYLIGGASTTTTTNSVQYIKINIDGSLASSWVTTSSFVTARAAFGGNFAVTNGGYIYVTSGCATLTTTACSTFTPTTFTSVTVNTNTYNSQTDFQYASINADGSLANFTVAPQNPYSSPAVAGTPLTSAASTPMTGYGLTAWRGALYGFGGCTAVSAAATCSGTSQTQSQYAVVNGDGDVSSTFGSPASTFYNGTSYASDLPALGNGANQAGRIAAGVVINNGFIYSIGGCANVGCTTMSSNIAMATIASNGTLSAWTTDSTHTLTQAVGAFGVTVNNNVVYVVGGFTGSANSQRVQYTTLSATGTLSNWTSAGNVASASAGYIFAFSRAVPASPTTSYLYMIGGCTGTTGIGCSGYVATVDRCTINNTGSTPTACNTAAQLQLQTGTGIFGGAVYGDYIYLSGGANSLTTTAISPTGATCNADPGACGGQTDITQYATVNPTGNITQTDNTTITGGWQVASSRLTEVRRRTTAFAINGYFYVVAGHDGTNGGSGLTLNDIQRGKINVNTGDITGFVALATTITSRWDLRAAQGSGYIYLLGGCTTGYPPSSCTAANGVSEYVQVLNNWNASPASYTSSPNQPATDRYGASATVLNGYLYLAGGCTTPTTDCSNSGAGTTSTDVSYAPINADGSVGTWTASSAAYQLPASRAFGALDAIGGTLYYTGGQTDNSISKNTIYYSTPSATTGLPAVWAATTSTLPDSRAQFGAAVYNNRIYVVGGFDGSNAQPTANIMYSPDLSAGGNVTGAWTTNTTSFNQQRSGESAVAYGNNLYILGGYAGTSYLLDTQYAPINADGSIGSFVYGASLPQTLRQGDAFATNGFLYIFGGRSAATTCTANTYDVPINADGSIGNWSQTSTVYSGTRWGVAATYYNGRAYLLGGVCGTTLTGTNNTVYGTLQIQPQVANYSLKIDTGSDTFPSKYLINGLDNGIGASWYLNYISSTAANNAWGQNTNVGRLVLGTPANYTALDASGTNTNFARYYMLFLKIDDQQAFGYPEDITRGPNIYDITLQFTSDPSKRLRNGKTFINNVQQPLDAPF